MQLKAAYVVRFGCIRGALEVICEVLDTQKKAHDALAENEARLQITLDADGAGIWEVSGEGREFVASDRALALHGLQSGIPMTYNNALAVVHPEDRQKVEQALCLTFETGAPFRVEFRCPRPDGSMCWLQSQGELRHFGGRRRLMGLVRDITERKHAEEHMHLLMREVNHRSRNMLAVVHSIARRATASNLEEFIDHFAERIQALSANQDLLVKNEWNGVEIEDLVCAQLAHFADLIGPRITIAGAKLRLNPASAQAIGLALHELATNAGTYGALSTDAGRVDVCWGTDGYTLTMSWTERDGPRVSTPKQRGFGTIVIKAMAEYSVDGAVDLNYAPSGVTWYLTCPAANALDSG